MLAILRSELLAWVLRLMSFLYCKGTDMSGTSSLSPLTVLGVGGVYNPDIFDKRCEQICDMNWIGRNLTRRLFLEVSQTIGVFHMKRKLYWDIALMLVIIGGFGAFILVQQQAPATEPQVQDVAKESTAGCCGASTVEGETSPATPGGCCGTSAPETAQSGDAAQQAQPPVVPEPRQTVPEAPQSDAADTGGCGCGSP